LEELVLKMELSNVSPLPLGALPALKRVTCPTDMLSSFRNMPLLEEVTAIEYEDGRVWHPAESMSCYKDAQDALAMTRIFTIQDNTNTTPDQELCAVITQICRNLQGLCLSYVDDATDIKDAMVISPLDRTMAVLTVSM
jgi:hypothetical protein